MAKYADGSMGAELTHRAILTFRNRCEQSTDFLHYASRVVHHAGYPSPFVALVVAIQDGLLPQGTPPMREAGAPRRDDLDAMRILLRDAPAPIDPIPVIPR